MTWILSALIGALLGFCSCLILIGLIRFPRRPVRFRGITWTGLLSYWTNRHLNSQLIALVRALQPQEQIQKFLLDPTTKDLSESWIRSQLSHYLANTLPEKWPMISLMIGDKTQDKILNAVSEHLQSNWTPTVLQLRANQLSEDKLVALLIRIMQLERPDLWTETIWRSFRKNIPSLFVLFVLTGSVLALVGRLLFTFLIDQ